MILANLDMEKSNLLKTLKSHSNDSAATNTCASHIFKRIEIKIAERCYRSVKSFSSWFILTHVSLSTTGLTKHFIFHLFDLTLRFDKPVGLWNFSEWSRLLKTSCFCPSHMWSSSNFPQFSCVVSGTTWNGVDGWVKLDGLEQQFWGRNCRILCNGFTHGKIK